MSYEGYEQWLCKSGHLHQFNCDDLPDEESWKCPDCGAKYAYSHGVDQTNGDGFGAQRFKIASGAVYCQCDCGHRHILRPAEYVVPDVSCNGAKVIRRLLREGHE